MKKEKEEEFEQIKNYPTELQQHTIAPDEIDIIIEKRKEETKKIRFLLEE